MTGKESFPPIRTDQLQEHLRQMVGSTIPAEVAVYGGSFNPPHICHILTTAYILSTQNMGQVWWIPTYCHAFGKQMVPFDLRSQMAVKAVEVFQEDLVKVVPIEKTLGASGGPTYTVDLMRLLVGTFPRTCFRLVLGTDLLAERHRWKEFDQLVKMAPPLVLGRQGHAGVEGFKPLLWLPDVSSTLVREKFIGGQDVSNLVPSQVVQFIKSHGLYRQGAK